MRRFAHRVGRLGRWAVVGTWRIIYVALGLLFVAAAVVLVIEAISDAVAGRWLSAITNLALVLVWASMWVGLSRRDRLEVVVAERDDLRQQLATEQEATSTLGAAYAEAVTNAATCTERAVLAEADAAFWRQLAQGGGR